jgi:hypothetical protein
MALKLLANNNAKSVLAAGISASATVITVGTGAGSLFPSPVSGQSYFKLTITDAATKSISEIMHVTSVSGDVMTVIRGQEGTTPRVWSTNDIVANMMTAGTLNYILANFQPLDATLTALAGLATGANKLPYFTGTDTAAQTDLTSVGRDIIGKNTIADILTYLGLKTAAQRNVGAGDIANIPDMSFFRACMLANGYVYLPVIGDGGGAQTFMIQWGQTSVPPNSVAEYNLNVAFPNSILFAVGNRWSDGSNASMNVKPLGTQQIQIQNWAPSGYDEMCSWLAIGY